MDEQVVNPIPIVLQSSVDPTQISLTIQSIGKSIAGIIVFFAMIKGVDPSVAQDQTSQLVAIIATAAPAAFTLWNSGNAIWGIARKILVNLLP